MARMAQVSSVLALLLFSCQGQTLVRFSPISQETRDGPQVASGYAYAFQALAHPRKSAKSLNGLVPQNQILYQGAPQIQFLQSNDFPSDQTYPKESFNYAQKHPLFSPQIIKTQYHSQDELGQYAYGYVHNEASHHEERTLDGGVQGEFSYYDNDGNKQSAKYFAGKNGFHVESSNLPLPVPPDPVQLTPEVAAATYAHLKAVEEARTRKRLGTSTVPRTVDTAEVAAARASHLRTFEDTWRQHLNRVKRSAYRGGHSQHRPSYSGFPSHGHGGFQSHGHGGFQSHGHGGFQSHGQGGFQSHGHGGFQSPGYSGLQQHQPHGHQSYAYSPPLPVTPTPDVQAAAQSHLQAVHQAHHYGGHAHVGIPDTPEVEAAKQAHFYAYNKIAQQHAQQW